MYLLDTNITSYFMHNSYQELTEKILSYDPSELLISSVTVFEFEYGAVKRNWGEKTYQKMLMFLSPFTVVPFTGTDAFTAGKIRASLAKDGNIIGPYDVMIAGQAVARDLTVVTHNTKEFLRVPALNVEDWVISASD